MANKEIGRRGEEQKAAGFGRVEKLTYFEGHGELRLVRVDGFNLTPGEGVIFMRNRITVLPIDEAISFLTENQDNPLLTLAALMSKVLLITDGFIEQDAITLGPSTPLTERAGLVESADDLFQYSWGNTQAEARKAASHFDKLKADFN